MNVAHWCISTYCTVCIADTRWGLQWALTIPKLVNIPHILWKPNVHYHIHKNSLLLPILRQINQVHISLQPTSWRSVLISSSHPGLGLPSSPLPSGVPIETPYTYIIPPPTPTACPTELILPNFITQRISGEEYRTQSCLLSSPLHCSVTLPSVPQSQTPYLLHGAESFLRS